MKLSKVFNRIKQSFSNGYSIIKNIRALPHSGKYSAIAVLLIIIFTALTFPYDYLIKKKIYEGEGKNFRSITIKSLDFNIIGETSAENVDVLLNNGQELSSKNILINPSMNPYRLFISRRFISDFQFDSFRFFSADAEIIMNLNGNIDIVFDKLKKIPSNGEVKLLIEECVIRLKEISIPGPMGPFPLKLDTINIQNGIAEIDIVNGIAKTRNFKLTGTDLTCSITGTVEIAERTDNTKLDLNISIDPDSAVLEQYKDMINLIGGSNTLNITIRGTAGKPDVKVSGTGKTE